MNGLRAAGATSDAAAASHGTELTHGHTDRAASHRVVSQRPIEGLSRQSRQHTTGTHNVKSPPTVVRGYQMHLQRLQDGSTAVLRCHPDHEPAEPLALAGRASDTAAAAPQDDAEFSFTYMEHAQVENSNGQVRTSSSAATAQDLQPEEGLASAKHLQRLEAAAAKWRQRSGSSNSVVAHQPCALDSYDISTQTATPRDEMAYLHRAQSWQPRRAFNNAESDAAVGVAARPEYDDQQSAFESLISVPPPPLRQTKISQAKTKASWMAALKGDAPPWLL